MSNKSEATWHPNSGPATDHADLISRLTEYGVDSRTLDKVVAALARHDAEVKAEALDSAAVDCVNFEYDEINFAVRTWLGNRAAAIRAEAG